MSGEKFEEAVKKLREELDIEFQLGYNYALEKIADDEISLTNVERYAEITESEYQIIRHETELYEASDAFLEGFTSACDDALKKAREKAG